MITFSVQFHKDFWCVRKTSQMLYCAFRQTQISAAGSLGGLHLLAELVELQKYALVEADLRLTVDKWAKELVICLLEITHGQYLYRNVMVNDKTAWELAIWQKEEIRQALVEQLTLGEDGLDEDDKFLLEINLDEWNASSGEDQEYWLLALQVAWEARHCECSKMVMWLGMISYRAAFNFYLSISSEGREPLSLVAPWLQRCLTSPFSVWRLPNVVNVSG